MKFTDAEKAYFTKANMYSSGYNLITNIIIKQLLKDIQIFKENNNDK